MIRILKNIFLSFKSCSLIWGNIDIDPSAKIRFSIIRGNIIIKKGVSIYRSDIYGNVTIGSSTALTGPGLYLHSNRKMIEIRSYVSIAPGVKIISSGHSLDSPSTSFRGGGEQTEYDIEIGNHSWIAAGAIITGGTIIEDYTVIAAGGVAIGNHYESGYIWGGVPIKKLKEYKASGKRA